MRAVLFDFGGTLDWPRHWLDRFLTHYHDAGLRLTRAELDPAFDAATRTAYRSSAALRNYGLAELLPFLVNCQLEYLRDLESKRVQRFAAELGTASVMRELTRRISDAFVKESIVGLARSRAVLATLGGDLKIGVVSNFYGNLERILDDAGFTALVAAIADSGKLGLYKPDPGIYRAALARLAVPATDAIMVGDSLDKDCAPARALGMRTVWLRHQDAPPADDQARSHADFTIISLEELNDLLCRIS
ncbi:MAG TPA: HAD family hydrolase [Candidatus Binataceae bacterium]|nr:HAD family hydrolase [Candidatus Binataceae bacterium]